MQFINHPLFEALGWTLIHSLWQATLLALLVFLGQQLLTNAPARRRFDLAGLALLTQLILSLGTFMLYWQGNPTAPIADGTFINIMILGEPGNTSTAFYWIPTLALVWSIGAIVSSARLLNSYLFTKKLSNSGQPISESWSARCHSLARRLQIKKPVQLLSSSMTQIPLTINHFKPLILFPIGLVNQLSNEEIEAILAHELAHIRRNDFILNIFFSFIEALFYYHPAIWWISARMNDAREESCDELAVQLVGNPLQYARTLVRVQENALALTQMTNWRTSMAFSGRKGHMQQRILRILNAQQTKHKKRDRLLAYLLVALIGGGLWISNLTANTPTEEFSANQLMEASEDNNYNSPNLPRLEAPWCISWGNQGEIAKLTIKEVEIPESYFQYYIDEINAWEKIYSPNCKDKKVAQNDNEVQYIIHSDVEPNSQNIVIDLTNKNLPEGMIIQDQLLGRTDALVFINTSPSEFYYPRAKTNLLVKLDTLPSRGTYNYQKNNDGNRTEIKIKDGVIEKLIIDGERISPREYDQYEDEVEEIMRQSPTPTELEFHEFENFDEIKGFDNFDDFDNFNLENFSLGEEYQEALEMASEALARQAKKMEQISEKLAAADLSIYSVMLEEYHQELESAQEKLQLKQEEFNVHGEERLLKVQEELESSQEAMARAKEEMHARHEELQAHMQERQEEMELHQEEMQQEMEQRQNEMQERLQAHQEELELKQERMEQEHEEHRKWNEQLRQEMIDDGLIREGQSVNMTFENGKMKVNGKQVQGELLRKYKQMLKEDNGPNLNNNSKYQFKMN